MSRLDGTLAEIKDASLDWLPSPAGCMSPDSHESAGAQFLTGVRDAVTEAWEAERFDRDSDHCDGDVVSEIADSAPPIYTHTRWQAFVDLGAYREEPEATDEWPADLTEAAGVALYQIAERLAYVLVQQLREAIAEDAENDEV
jgi:hypothetical protein